MRVAAIIAEYNPFHCGHGYHIAQTRDITQCDYLIVVMSGDFTQRGIPALMPKHERAAIALSQGADLVLELPVTYATGSAERFALGAVSLLDRLHFVNDLSFGCENDSLPLFQALAAFLASPPDSYQQELNEALKLGHSYPRARAIALSKHLELPAHFLAQPNNILAIEYQKALYALHSTIEPVAIKRQGAGYHDTTLSGNGFASASGIRHQLSQMTGQPFSALAENLHDKIPTQALQLMENTYQKTWPIFPKDFQSAVAYRLLSHDFTANAACENDTYQDLSDELWNKMRKEVTHFLDLDSFILSLKSKELTYSRIARAILHLVLQTPNDFPALCPYARVLGFQKEAEPLFSHLKDSTSIPLVTKTADARNQLDNAAFRMLSHDIHCSHVYHAMATQKYGTPLLDEYRTQFPVL